MEGHTGKISAIPNLPSQIPVMGSRRCHGASSSSTSSRSSRPRGLGCHRSFYRWFLCRSQKRGLSVGKTKRGKGTKIMAIADRRGLPVSICIASASPHEVTLVEQTLNNGFIETPPKKLIGDKAYDSDALDGRLANYWGIEMIAPHRANRHELTQDGRPLRRYKKRWKVERLFAWLYNFRRLVVRYEYYSDNFLGMLQLACIIILMRYL